MKYLLLLHRKGDNLPTPGTAEARRLFEAYATATDAMRSAGVYLDGAPLAGASSATTVRVRDGEILLTDGPAAELKEQVGGYVLLECADLEDAVRWAATIPAAHDTSVEVRPLVSVQVPA